MINKYVLMYSILFIFLLAYLGNELSLAFKNNNNIQKIGKIIDLSIDKKLKEIEKDK